jgi:hypothetical protein
MRSIKKFGNSYIANAKNQRGFIQTFIKRSKDSTWMPIEFENTNQVFKL